MSIDEPTLGPAEQRFAPRLAIAAGAIVLGLAAFFPVWTNDLFGHLAAGRQIVELGRVPHHDTFSFYFDSPRPWRNHNWGSCLLFYVLYQLGGFDALVACKVAVCAALGGVLVATCGRRPAAAAVLCAVLLSWAVPTVRLRFSVRPHIFGLLACALLIQLLLSISRLDPERKPWRLYATIAALQLFWVNLHGSGPMAFLLTLAFIVGHHGHPRAQKRFALALLVQVVVSGVTPFGPALLLETFHHVSSEGTREFIGEWNPLVQSDNPWDVPACTAELLLLLSVALPLMRSGPATRSWLLATLGLFVMAFRSVRFVAEPLLLGAPCLATGLALRLSRVTPRVQRLLVASAGAIGLLAGLRVAPHVPPFQSMGSGLSPRNLPMQPGRWLAAHRPRARIVGLMEDCWYLSFAVPQSHVLIDGRQAVYPLDVLMSVTRALDRPAELAALVANKRVDAIVLRHTRAEHAASIAALLRDSTFRLATIGDRHVLFVRDLPVDQAVTALQPNFMIRSFDPALVSRARAELAALGRSPGVSEYGGFQAALLELSPYMRNGGADGIEPIADRSQAGHYAQALRELSPALPANEEIAPAHVLAAMVDLSLCRCDEAEAELAQARAAGENRYTLALRVELAVRRGQLERARDDLAALSSGGSDPWLDALQRALDEARVRPLCPQRS